jgi:hypothetical protein
VAVRVTRGGDSSPSAGPSPSPSESSGSSSSASPSDDASPPAVKPLKPRSCAKKPDTTVSTASELQEALNAAKPGTSIHVEDGTYQGEFEIKSSGTAARPIELCGSTKAVLTAGPVDGGGYDLHLDGVEHWDIVGLSLQGGQKGLVADKSSHNVIDGITVSGTGDEAIHLRDASTHNLVQRSTVRDTGHRKPQYGEGIYIGTAQSNWCEISSCDPDRSDHNVIRNNDVADTSAENVDIKEGTTAGVLQDNTFSGAGMTEGDSWVDVKGNNWTIAGNRGTDAPEDGYQVHQILDGWGQKNTFTGNDSDVGGGGYAINVTKRHDDNVVTCDNKAHNAGNGLTTIDCS